MPTYRVQGYSVFRFLTDFGWKSRFGDRSYGRIKCPCTGSVVNFYLEMVLYRVSGFDEI